MNIAAITHDYSILNGYMISDTEAVIKVRTEKNDISKMCIHYADKYTRDRENVNYKRSVMKKVAHDSIYDYYEGIMVTTVEMMKYFIEAEDTAGNVAYIGAGGFYETKPTDYLYMYDLPRRSRREDSLDVPDWSKSAVVYQIFPDRFHTGGDKLPKNWYDPVTYRSHRGGTIRGIINHLDHIKSVGANVVYMTPLFKSPSNHKYDTEDYYQLDPDFGTNEDMKELVSRAHEMDMKVVIDGVFNHSGYSFEPFQDVLEKGEASQYADWFEVERFPLFHGSRTKYPSYDTFGHHGNMPKLKTRNKDLTKYLLDVVAYWTREIGIDGWRLDVADEVSMTFWRTFRRTVKSINPEALIIGEVWYDSTEWLRGDTFDTVMNYDFRYAVLHWLCNRTITAPQFADRINQVRGRYPRQAVNVLWNLLGSHDTARFLTEAGGDKDILKLGILLQGSITGVPFLYYGDEVGMDGGHDPGCRMGMLWDEERRDNDVLAFTQKLMALHSQHPALREGELMDVLAHEAMNLYIFKKVHEDETLTVIINNGGEAVKLETYQGQMDLITGETFSGMLGGKKGLIL